LTFENAALADGWDVNKEKDNTCILLRKNDLYFLAIMPQKDKTAFDQSKGEHDIKNMFYEKMEYKQIANPTKDIPNLVRIDGKVVMKRGRKNKEDGINHQREKILNENLPERINEIRNDKSYLKTSNNFNKDDLTAYIAYYQELTKEYFDFFNFSFKKPKDYKNWAEFTKHCKEQGYSVKFERKISENYINQLVEDGKLYLFQIYNKDFSEFSKGMPNMHTLYWKMLFDNENLKNVIYKLNGEAEVFFRKKSLIYSDKKIWDKGHHYNELKDKFTYPIISNRRYALDKFLFHCPITVNFKSIGNDKINDMVNLYIKNNHIQYIIGIDRGERNLLYVNLTDPKGNIVKQFSLNTIESECKGKTYKKNYHDLLAKKEGDRNLARKSWQTIEKIKEIKEGYLSQAIHIISDLIFYDGEDENGKIKKADYPTAIVVLEELNDKFIRRRQKFEKQVYQKFVKMFIEKLNYLVDKRKNKNEKGGLFNAHQLTNKFKSFKELGKQNGFLFFISPWNTSNIDPVTGFVNMFNTHYTNAENAKEFFNKFADIRYNNTKNYFEFVVDDYRKFNVKINKDTRLNWIICTNGDRIRTFKNSAKNNQWDSESISLTDKLTDLLKEYFNDYEKEIKNLKESILNQTNKEFFKQLLYLFKLTLQMRNNIPHSDADYIISPIADADGEFFDSRKGKSNLPVNADANGAYNIARKGLLIINQIENSDNLKKIKIAISNKEWLKYAQK
jgi:hypothetical protein